MQIFSVHPADGNLKFLRDLNDKLKEKYGPEYTYLRLEANYKTHEKCISVLNQNDTGLLFFFCHAMDKTIRGCHIDSNSSSHSYKNFHYGALISPSKNLSIFRGKKVFCLACNSKEIGQYAIDNQAQVFLGFGDIPFFLTENYKEDQVTELVKSILKDIIYSCLVHSIDNELTFNQLSIMISSKFDKVRYNLLSGKSNEGKRKVIGKRLRFEVANVLSKIKRDITMFGNGNTLVS